MAFRGVLALTLLATLAHGGPVDTALRLDLDACIDTSAAWLEPAAPSTRSVVHLDDRVPMQALVLESLTERGRWPAKLTVTIGDEEMTVTIPRSARDAHALTLRFGAPRSLGAVEVDDGDDSLLEHRARLRPITAAELRGDTLEALLPGVVGTPEERVQLAGILGSATESAYDAIGRQWRSLEAPAQLTILDRLGPSRCTAGLSFLARLVVEGGESGERAERLVNACGPRAAEGLAVRFQSLDLAHRAKLAMTFAKSDGARALPLLLDAATAADGSARRALRAALAQAARRLSESLLRERLRDAALPLETRLTLAATVPSVQHAGDLVPIARAALESAAGTTRRRGAWVAASLPAGERATLLGSLRDAYTREEDAATREAIVDAIGTAATDEDVSRFLDDRSPSVRARAATLAEECAIVRATPAIRARFANETWLLPATRMAHAIATLEASDDTKAALRARYESATNSAFASAFLEARALAGDREVLAPSRKLVRDDRALLELRIAGVRAFRTLRERSLNADLVRLARRALEPLTEDDLPLAYACLEALGELADGDDLDRLRPLLEAKDPALRHAARAALREGHTP